MKLKNLYYVCVDFEGIKPSEEAKAIGWTRTVSPKALLIVAKTPKQAIEFANKEYRDMALNFKWVARKIGTTTKKQGVMGIDVIMKK